MDRRSYRKVYRRLWTHEAFKAFTHDNKVVALYILSGPQTNRIGIFRLSCAQLGEDCGVRKPRVSVERVCEAMGWHYDAKASVVWLQSWWSWNPPGDRPTNIRGMLTDLNDVPRCELVAKFCANVEDLPENLHQYLSAWAKHSLSTSTARAEAEHSTSTARSTGRAHPYTETETETETETVTLAPTVQVVDDGFDSEFWPAYPKKVAKEDARRAWKKLNLDRDQRREVIDRLELQKRSDAWTREGGRFAPHPATWLNGKRWRDELPEAIPQLTRRNQTTLGAAARIIAEES